MAEDGRKMSKRYGNVINPDEIVKNIGADSLRVYEMFMGPFDQAIGWNTNNAVGARRFIERVWRLQEKVTEAQIIATGSSSERMNTLVHKTIKKVTEDIEAMRFNTAISSMMILVNELEREASVSHEHYDILIKLLAPFAPHVTEEIWLASMVRDSHKGSIHISEWPKFDPAKVTESKARIAVQVGGKTRAMFDADVTASDDTLKAAAMELPEVKKWVGEKAIKKVIVVKGRLVSIVI
jgi:leucyl-tRNA synthetase